MENQTVFIFTHFGLGNGPNDLQKALANKFLAVNLENNTLPAKILFYTDGVKLACKGSNVINLLKNYQEKGVELILCSTCLEHYQLSDQVQVGVVGGMGDIIEVLSKAQKVISL